MTVLYVLGLLGVPPALPRSHHRHPVQHWSALSLSFSGSLSLAVSLVLSLSLSLSLSLTFPVPSEEGTP